MSNTIDIKKTDNSLNLNENWGWFIDIDNQANLQKNRRKNKINTVIIKIQDNFDEIDEEYEYYIKMKKKTHNLETIEEENEFLNEDNNNNNNNCYKYNFEKIISFVILTTVFTFIILLIF
jgi:hypothetical protein